MTIITIHRLVVGSEALEAVKILAFSSPLWKRGAGGSFIIKSPTHLCAFLYGKN